MKYLCTNKCSKLLGLMSYRFIQYQKTNIESIDPKIILIKPLKTHWSDPITKKH